MKPFRWLPHAIDNLADREIERADAEEALFNPEAIVPGRADAAPPTRSRSVYLRRYSDQVLSKEMLLCAVIEETMEEGIVVTVFKTSKIAKYLKGIRP